MNDQIMHRNFLDTAFGRIEFRRFTPDTERSTRGSEQSPTSILLLHEGLGCVALWRDFPRRLADTSGREILVYSRPGYGHSSLRSRPTSSEYMHEEALEVLPEILDRAQVERAVLLGHSDGGSIATIYAGRNQDPRIRALVLIAAHFFVEDVSIRSIERAAHLFATTELRDKLARYHPDKVDSMFAIWRDAWLAPEFRSWNVLPDVGRLDIPVLALQGCDDEYGSDAQIRQLTANYSGPYLQTELLSRCRHAPHLECPDRTLELVRNFVEAHAP